MKTTSLSNIQQEEDFKTLCQMTTNLLELSEGELASRSRKKHLQLPRMVVSVVANMIDETHYNIIAKGINRDRTCINYYVNMHQSNYRTYPEYRDLFNNIYDKYSNIKESKKTFDDKYRLKHHLISNNIKDSEKKQVKIQVKSGKISVNVNVSYQDFSKTLELISFAMQDCNYKLLIK